MFTDYRCPVCDDAQRKKGLTEWEVTRETGAMEMRMTTAPVSVDTCANGHRCRLVALDGAYSLFFERALQRLAVGNPRDAVLDAQTAFEMYLSHIPARSRYDREKGTSPRVLRTELKPATLSAERAIGAALATVAVVSSLAPPKIDTRKTTTLRNNAAHAGEYPEDAEAEDMCLEVERLIYEFDARMGTQTCVNTRSYWDVAINEEIEEEIERQALKDVPGTRRNFGTVLAANRREGTPFPASRRLADYRKNIVEDRVHWRIW